MGAGRPWSVAVRYPGRACLLGEHCDWAGGASLAVPLPLGVRVKARPGAAGTGVSLESQIGGVPLSGHWDVAGSVDPDGGPLRFVSAVLHLLTGLGLNLPATALVVESDLPSGRGFSSSAAFTLGVLDAMARRAGKTLEKETLAELAYEVERDLLGVECGRLDQIACAEAAPVFIEWDGSAPNVRAIAPGTSYHLVALALPTPRDTTKILATLNRHHADPRGDASSPQRRAVRTALATFAAEATRGAAALEIGDPASLGEAMNRAQSVYERELERSLPELESPVLRRTCARLRSEGALGAKFSGAGGDGSVIALFAARDQAQMAVRRLTAEGAGTAVYCPIG